MSCGEVLGHRGCDRLGKIKGCCTIAVVGKSTAFKMIAAHQAVLARLPWAPQLPRLQASRADKANPQPSLTYPT